MERSEDTNIHAGAEKKEYHAPQFRAFGTIQELTKAGMDAPLDDGAGSYGTNAAVTS